jgi:hypothetical protein
MRITLWRRQQYTSYYKCGKLKAKILNWYIDRQKAPIVNKYGIIPLLLSIISSIGAAMPKKTRIIVKMM